MYIILYFITRKVMLVFKFCTLKVGGCRGKKNLKLIIEQNIVIMYSYALCGTCLLSPSKSIKIVKIRNNFLYGCIEDVSSFQNTNLQFLIRLSVCFSKKSYPSIVKVSFDFTKK